MKRIELVRGREYKYPKKHIPELCGVFKDFSTIIERNKRSRLIGKIVHDIIRDITGTD